MYGQYSGTVNIPETVTYMGHTRQVTSIGKEAFSCCYELQTVSIPNTVKIIKEMAFFDNQNLTTLTIGNSVETIENSAFYRCWNLETLVIPNSVLYVKESAFRSCNKLTTLSIGNNVKEVGSLAFESCDLRSLIIPSSITSIGDYAFKCSNLSSVISFIQEPFEIDDNTFSANTFYNATLRVPDGTIEKYKNTTGWKKFVFIDGISNGETEQCAKPVIGYNQGKLTFRCDTEGAICHSTITDNDIKSYLVNEIQLGVTYNISVYATKEGFLDSEVATATLCWIDQLPATEGFSGVSEVRANAVMIQSINGTLTVSGVTDGKEISVYSVSGQIEGSAKSRDNQANIITHLRKGDVAIIKIGDKSIKTVVQ